LACEEVAMNQRTQWQVGGNAAEIYQQHLVPTVFGPWATDLIEATSPGPGERVLDVACGTGVVARLAAERVATGGRVVGLDLNPGMLAIARSVASLTPIDWREGNAVALPFEGGAFDVVLCQQGVQFFPDRPAALREMHRVLVPGGRLGLATWRPIQQSPGFAALARAMERHVGPEAAALVQAPFSFGDAGELRALVLGAGFWDVEIRPAAKPLRFPSVDEFVWRYVAASPLAGQVSQVDDRARAALVADVRDGLRAHVSPDGLEFPIESHLTVACR
jgi:ubiquinone/menaquinone biosynthesis C-methylase UbiE